MLHLEVRVHSQVGFIVGRVVLGQEFLGDFRLFSVAVIPSVRHNRI